MCGWNVWNIYDAGFEVMQEDAVKEVVHDARTSLASDATF